MTSHDPTTANNKNTHIGSQYRSVIFYHSLEQKEIADTVIQELASFSERPITTEISPAINFYAAEGYHQNYYANNQTASYCKGIIAPKLAKLRKMHARKLKTLNVA